MTASVYNAAVTAGVLQERRSDFGSHRASAVFPFPSAVGPLPSAFLRLSSCDALPRRYADLAITVSFEYAFECAFEYRGAAPT